MARIAIIGTGVAGLSAAYHLHRNHEITVYEKEGRVGGHTRTLVIRYGDRELAVDTGFIVFNERNYPNLTRAFRDLGVGVQKSNMSFALTAENGRFEWGAESLDAIFGQRRNLFSPKFYRLLGEVAHFNRKAQAEAEAHPDISLGDLIAHMGLSDRFRWHYLLPMAGAIWSCPPRQMLSFPALTFIRFFGNHGLLSVNGQPEWHTVVGGSQNYVERMIKPFGRRIQRNRAAVDVRRERGLVRVLDSYGNSEVFDHVVLASHADETLALLGDATSEERRLLGAFAYQRNRAVLHRDPQFMPKRKRCWASWVYHSDGLGDEAAITVSYWMNRLQSIDPNCPLFVTLNPTRDIPDELVFDAHDFMHPVFDRRAIAAQPRLQALQGVRNTWFCGAYMGHGFHEDGFVSGMSVAARLDALPRHLSRAAAWPATHFVRPNHQPAALAVGD